MRHATDMRGTKYCCAPQQYGNKQNRQNGLTVRAKTLYETGEPSEADIPWTRGIYRQIDLTQEKNMPLYYPEEIIDGQENLFRVLLGLVASNKIKVYEYLDGREIFTEEYEVKVEDMLERFHILYEVKAGRTAKRNTYIIEESDVPCNEVLSYYVKEKWIFDQRSSTCYPVIEAICPVLHRVGDFGGEAVRTHVLGPVRRYTSLLGTTLYHYRQHEQRTQLHV